MCRTGWIRQTIEKVSEALRITNEKNTNFTEENFKLKSKIMIEAWTKLHILLITDHPTSNHGG